MGQGAYILGCAGPRLERDEAAFFAEAAPWGFILFARNIETPDQVRGLCADLRDTVGRDAPILIDQEGGRVQRLRPPHWRQWLAPRDHVDAAGDAAERAMWLRGRLIADELRGVGVDVNCAPCADVARAITHPFLADRCYGDTPETVATLARAIAEGQAAGGVQSVLKHIPGHGRGEVDSHLGLPVVSADRTDLDADFAPFRELADLPMAMTAHIVFSAIDPDRPVTQSPEGISAIRETIGFAGLLMTDDVSMQALGGSIADRAGSSLKAGCDVVLHCNGDRAEMEDVVTASGAMGPAAQERADAVIAARPNPQDADTAALADELAGLLRSRTDA
ncbi:beta-N-acetylhexosaminidase [Tranquillimonas rosea]|uniref:beta-N-acetylhexosaminidase n=1 Tax=Tranquillimonas rosea TaxID=641238 RepID=A0A1H9TJE2_9RHOB|nr:glycoside hydrolase family 3 N-terminal domain-containing protein [Tranquillimonas rosea]SER97167.1 beta-N-acetylhexosaminidase [Tranquillimonas rosea]